MSRNPVAIISSAYDEEIAVTSINAFKNNLEMIENVIFSILANQNKAPYQLIKKRAENQRFLTSTSNSQLKFQHSAHSGSGQLKTFKPNQFCSKYLKNSQLKFSHPFIQLYKQISKFLVKIISQIRKISQKTDVKGFKGRLIPADLNTLEAQGRDKTQMVRFLR